VPPAAPSVGQGGSPGLGMLGQTPATEAQIQIMLCTTGAGGSGDFAQEMTKSYENLGTCRTALGWEGSQGHPSLHPSLLGHLRASAPGCSRVAGGTNSSSNSEKCI